MSQVARQLVDSLQGSALGKTHLIIDRDTKYVDGFRHTLDSAGVKIVLCPPRVPQCNAFAERFVRSIKESCLDRMVLMGEASLHRATTQFVLYHHQERKHQGLENKIIRPEFSPLPTERIISCRHRLGGMLNYYYCEAA